MKKEKRSASSTSRSSMAPVWVLAALVAVGVLWFDRAPSRRWRSPGAVPSAASSSPWAGIADWPVAMRCLALRPELERWLERHLDQGKIPGWSSFTRESLAGLNVRRKRMQEWGEAHHPAVAFFAQVHEDPRNRTPERVREVEILQERLFQRVRAAAQGADVVVIEEHGCAPNERLTPDAMARVGKAQLAESGIYATDAEIRKMMEGLRMASMRMILEAPGTVVTCGEEWPSQIELSLLAAMSQAPPEFQPNARRLAEALSRLRSEIILIRALEWLSSQGGATALVIQGVNHLPEIERLAPEYGIRLTVTLPD